MGKLMEVKTESELIKKVVEAFGFGEIEQEQVEEEFHNICSADNDDEDLIDPMSSVTEEDMKAEERIANRIMTAFRFTYPNETKSMIELYDENPDLVLIAFSSVIKMIKSINR